MNWMDLLPYALKILGFLLDRSRLSDKAKQRFIDLVEQAASEGAISADLRDRFKRQQDEP
jgi:hypothetical protein